MGRYDLLEGLLADAGVSRHPLLLTQHHLKEYRDRAAWDLLLSLQAGPRTSDVPFGTM